MEKTTGVFTIVVFRCVVYSQELRIQTAAMVEVSMGCLTPPTPRLQYVVPTLLAVFVTRVKRIPSFICVYNKLAFFALQTMTKLYNCTFCVYVKQVGQLN